MANSAREYTIVAGDFVRTGGMDLANYSFAKYLARAGRIVHLVSHRIADDLATFPNVVFHRVPRPGNAHALGAPLLGGAGMACAARMGLRGGAVVVNGGNCAFPGANWVHYLHAGHRQVVAGSAWKQARARGLHSAFEASERLALGLARVIIANSEKTRREVIERIGVREERVRTVYLGVDPSIFRPASGSERGEARKALGWPEDRPRVVFIGALGDRRKGFDIVYEAWRRLCSDPTWDANLVVVGQGAELRCWHETAVLDRIAARIDFLGYRRDVHTILSACDGLVAPTRYEPYGLGVHEALCCGVPAIVSRHAGVAERYSHGLRGLLLENPEDIAELCRALAFWHGHAEALREETTRLASLLRARTWDDMAKDIESICDTLA